MTAARFFTGQPGNTTWVRVSFGGFALPRTSQDSKPSVRVLISAAPLTIKSLSALGLAVGNCPARIHERLDEVWVCGPLRLE